jgi:hypothetical protein
MRFVVASDTTDLVAKLEAATRLSADLDWRIHDVVLVPVRSL